MKGKLSRADDERTRRLAARVLKQDQRERETKAKQKAQGVYRLTADVIDRGLTGDLMRRCLKEMWLRGWCDRWPEGEAPPAELRREYQRLLRLTDQFRAKWRRDWHDLLPPDRLDDHATFSVRRTTHARKRRSV